MYLEDAVHELGMPLRILTENIIENISQQQKKKLVRLTHNKIGEPKFYYARKDTLLAKLLDKVFPASESPIRVYGESSGDDIFVSIYVRPEYKETVKALCDNFPDLKGRAVFEYRTLL